LCERYDRPFPKQSIGIGRREQEGDEMPEKKSIVREVYLFLERNLTTLMTCDDECEQRVTSSLFLKRIEIGVCMWRYFIFSFLGNCTTTGTSERSYSIE
jgi:hypothetical protein